MKKKFLRRLFCFLLTFTVTFVFGLVSFNLFYINEKLQMLQAADGLHRGQMNNDKILIDRLLTENFTETGVRFAVQTPEVINKNDLLKADYSNVNFTIKARFAFLSYLLGNDTNSLSFVREIIILPESGKEMPPIIFYVTYTFEKGPDGLKISKIKRNL